MFFNRKKKGAPSGPSNHKQLGSEPSFIGRNTTIDGQVVCDGELHVDGTVRGSVRAQLCVIDMNGVVQGDVGGDVVHVRGRVIGPIQGVNVHIHAGAHVEGDVFHDTISIENGAYIYGSIRHNSAPAPVQPQQFQNAGRKPPFQTPPPIEVAPPSLNQPDTPEEQQKLRMIHSRKP